MPFPCRTFSTFLMERKITLRTAIKGLETNGMGACTTSYVLLFHSHGWYNSGESEERVSLEWKKRINPNRIEPKPTMLVQTRFSRGALCVGLYTWEILFHSHSSKIFQLRPFLFYTLLIYSLLKPLLTIHHRIL